MLGGEYTWVELVSICMPFYIVIDYHFVVIEYLFICLIVTVLLQLSVCLLSLFPCINQFIIGAQKTIFEPPAIMIE